MNPKDAFLASNDKNGDKINFALNAYGHVTHIIKRVDLRLYEVFSRLQAIRCANLPVLFDLIKQDDYLEVHEEYIRGRTVEQLRQENGTLDDKTLISVATDVCRALIAVHGAQPPIVHRDIKPQNIMERESGGYVLIDFDAARIYHEDASVDTRCIATVGYAAPEQYGLSQTDVRSDIFSLGVTLYELKTGETFHMGAVCGGPLGRIIAKCTAFEPNKRFRNATLLLKRLEGLQPGFKRAISKPRLWAVLLSCAAVIALLLAVYFSAIGKKPQEAFVPAVTETPDSGIAPVVLNPPAHDEIPCTCRFATGVLTSPDGLILEFSGAPVSVQLELTSCTFNRSGCNALVHHTSVDLAGFTIQNMTIGAKAEITDDGMLTIFAEGMYAVDALAVYGDNVGGPVEAVVIATDKPQIYSECNCALDVKKTFPVFNSAQVLPADGSPLYLELRVNPVYDSRLCNASEHRELLPLMGYIEVAPEGAVCGVTKDNRFFTYTPGTYEVRTPAYYNGELINFGCQINISQANGG